MAKFVVTSANITAEISKDSRVCNDFSLYFVTASLNQDKFKRKSMRTLSCMPDLGLSIKFSSGS
jgi:hypothetical protein